MASQDAPKQTTASATVLRATDRQVRLRLDDASGGREITKRVPVPTEARGRLEGTAVPIVVHGSGARARVELAENWLDPAAEAPPAARRRSRTRSGATSTDEKPATSAAEAPKRRTRTRSRSAATAPPEKTAAPEQPAAADEASGAAASRRRSRGGAKAKDAAPKAKGAAPSSAPAPVDPAFVRRRIADAVELVRAARR